MPLAQRALPRYEPSDKEGLNMFAGRPVAVGGSVLLCRGGMPSPWRSHVVYG